MPSLLLKIYVLPIINLFYLYPLKSFNMLLKNSFMTRYRFKLLLISILIFLIVPAFITSDIYHVILILAMSFIFLQSIWVFTSNKRNGIMVTVAAITLLVVSWYSEFSTADYLGVRIFKLSLYVLFFLFVLVALFRALLISKRVTVDSIIIAVAIYCLFGIIGGSLALLLNTIYPGLAYNLPESIQHADLLDFTYYSFVTLTTLGYGDITPIRQETQALSYLLAVLGQFYVAVIVAILVSKLVSKDTQEAVKDELK
jgi:hypothetical protein